jgi:hypothetical protein
MTRPSNATPRSRPSVARRITPPDRFRCRIPSPNPNLHGSFRSGGPSLRAGARYEPTPGSIWSEVYDGQLHVGGGHTAFHTKIARFSPGFGCGDFNGDGFVDQQDLGILLAAFDNCPGPNCPGDANGDGVVYQQDQGILLKHFGAVCP